MTPAARKLLTTWLGKCEVDHDGNALASSIVREMVRQSMAALDAAERRAAEAEGEVVKARALALASVATGGQERPAKGPERTEPGPGVFDVLAVQAMADRAAQQATEHPHTAALRALVEARAALLSARRDFHANEDPHVYGILKEAYENAEADEIEAASQARALLGGVQ